MTQVDSGEGVTRTYELLDQLIEDVGRAFEELEGDKASQFRRRAAVRTVFSMIEGAVSIVKFELRRELRRSWSTHRALSEFDREFLYERRHRRDGSYQPLHFSLENSIKQTFKLAAKIWGLQFRLDMSSGWKDLSAARGTRNRLTHPRTYYDLQIADAEMGSLAASYLWFKREFARLWREHVNAMAAELSLEERAALVGP